MERVAAALLVEAAQLAVLRPREQARGLVGRQRPERPGGARGPRRRRGAARGPARSRPVDAGGRCASSSRGGGRRTIEATSAIDAGSAQCRSSRISTSPRGAASRSSSARTARCSSCRSTAPPACAASAGNVAPSARDLDAGRRSVRGQVRVQRVDQQRVRHVALVLRAARAEHQRPRVVRGGARGARAGSSCRSPPRRRSRSPRGRWSGPPHPARRPRPTGRRAGWSSRLDSGPSRCGRDLRSLPLITSSYASLNRAAGPVSPALVAPVIVITSFVPAAGAGDRGRRALDRAGEVQPGVAADVDLLA